MAIIVAEGSLELSDLLDETNFSNLHVGSLMSHNIAEKFRE